MDFMDIFILKFRMWFKHGLKAQKLLAQSSALGIIAISNAPCKGKSFVIAWYLKAFALTGRQACVHHYPGRCPGLGASALSGRVGDFLETQMGLTGKQLNLISLCASERHEIALVGATFCPYYSS